MTTNRQMKKLGEVVDILDNQRVPISSEEREKRNQGKLKNQLYPYYGATRQNGWIDDYIFDEELVLLGEDGADFYDPQKEKAYMINGKSWVNNHAHVLKGKKGILDNKFLCSYLNNIDYHGYVSGATRLKLNQGSMKEIQIPLPPLDIQKAIVAKLDETFAEMDEAISTTQANIEKTNEFTKSVLDRVFEEVDWEKKPVKEISEKIQYGYTGKVVDKGVYRYLRITDIQNGGVERETVPFCDIDDTEAKKYLLNEGDIVFARTGATVGKSFLINKPGVGNVFASYLIRIVSDKKNIFPEFLLYFFQSNKYRNQIFGEVVGAAQPNFNGNKLGEIVLPIPPLAKQTEIVKYLDEVFAETSELKSQYQNKLIQLKELKASILQSAFEGK